MLDEPNHIDELDSLLIHNSNVDELRVQRVWRFFAVALGTWIFFSCFLWIRSHHTASLFCLAAAVGHLFVYWLGRNSQKHSMIMNLSLTVSGACLHLVACVDESLSSTILFYPISIIVASQLVGIRTAFYWLASNVMVLFSFYISRFGLEAMLSSPLTEELVLRIGVSGCIFACCQQSEEFYRRKTSGLIDLSRHLKERSDEFRALAITDSLTGLTNRMQFQRELADSMAKAVAKQETMGLLMIDIDGFKEVNDAWGHAIGDQALIEISRRLQENFGMQSRISRLGGDEFCVILPYVSNSDVVVDLANDVLEVLTADYRLPDADFTLGASIGSALCPADAVDSQQLLAFADTAMFHAKERQLGHACYDSSMTDRIVERRTMNRKLAHAIANEEFFLVYQPQVDLQTGNVFGVEALLRWRSDGEIIPPDRFIPFLEASREIIPVGRWVIQESCRQQVEWKKQGFDVEVSLNVSAVQFTDPKFVSCIAESVQEYGVDPERLDIEITEGLLIDDVEQAIERLWQIKKLGAQVSIDDFGTGYSSLAYLQQFPLDRLKIDRGFIKDIPDSDDGVIAASIIVLAKSLGVKVIAEGVETEEQRQFVLQHDCDQYQGYHFSRPLPKDEVIKCFQSLERSDVAAGPVSQTLHDSEHLFT